MHDPYHRTFTDSRLAQLASYLLTAIHQGPTKGVQKIMKTISQQTPSNGTNLGKMRSLCSSKSVVDFSVVISEQDGRTFDAVHVHANITQVEVIRTETRYSRTQLSRTPRYLKLKLLSLGYVFSVTYYRLYWALPSWAIFRDSGVQLWQWIFTELPQGELTIHQDLADIKIVSVLTRKVRPRFPC